MTDDLLKALKSSVYLAFDDGTNDYTTALKAAEHIEELETKLAKAVEIFQVELAWKPTTPGEEPPF